MIIKPMIRNSICMNAHPDGCERLVQEQIAYVRGQAQVAGPRRVLIIGASTGYGLAARIVSAFSSGAATLGVAFERAGSERRTGTPGWYNTYFLEQAARGVGLITETLFGDAFSDEIRAKTIAMIGEQFGTVDLVLYSLASGVRTDPKEGVQYRSVLKPIGAAYSAQSLDPMRRRLQQVTIEPANDEEIAATVKVMGGEDWALWIDALLDAKVLAPGARTVAFSYIGPELTHPIYRDGTIGRAKQHLEQTARTLDRRIRKALGARALISINKALVTRASAVIPVVPLYLTLLFKTMKKAGLHEDCIQQMYRLFAERLYRPDGKIKLDKEKRVRLDDWEMRPDIQSRVAELWPQVTKENLETLADIDGYVDDFLHIHGFGYPGIDYDKDVQV